MDIRHRKELSHTRVGSSLSVFMTEFPFFDGSRFVRDGALDKIEIPSEKIPFLSVGRQSVRRAWGSFLWSSSTLFTSDSRVFS